MLICISCSVGTPPSPKTSDSTTFLLLVGPSAVGLWLFGLHMALGAVLLLLCLYKRTDVKAQLYNSLFLIFPVSQQGQYPDWIMCKCVIV